MSSVFNIKIQKWIWNLNKAPLYLWRYLDFIILDQLLNVKRIKIIYSQFNFIIWLCSIILKLEGLALGSKGISISSYKLYIVKIKYKEKNILANFRSLNFKYKSFKI